MNVKYKHFVAAFVNILIICLLSALRYSGVATFKIGSAVPIILLPLIIAVAMFFSDNASLLAALLAGTLMDSMSAESSWFNTLFFVVAAIISNLLGNRFFNRNLKAALYLSSLVSLIYFFFKYLIFFVFRAVEVNYDYFVLYLIPSVVYTAVFIIPFYLLEKKLAQ